MRNRFLSPSLAGLLIMALAPAAMAQETKSGIAGWFAGDWYLEVGGAVFTAPEFEGDDAYQVMFSPIISLGKAGNEARFSSRNDNISFGLIDTGWFRAGPNAKLIWPRDGDDADDLNGLKDVDFGVELGGFAELYPTDWLRLRGEIRQGFGGHEGVVADFAADAFTDITPEVRISGGPRLSFASADYFDAYYGVDAAEAAATGLSEYSPGSGMRSYGVGGAIDWKTTDRLTTSLFAEYSRLTGPAADSSIVKERGSPNQYLLGVSATYRFDFSL